MESIAIAAGTNVWQIPAVWAIGNNLGYAHDSIAQHISKVQALHGRYTWT